MYGWIYEDISHTVRGTFMVRIITDSSSLYTVEEGRYGIDSVPLSVSIGDCHGRDLQMDMPQFYKRIDEGQIPTSSQPPIGEVLDTYEKYRGSRLSTSLWPTACREHMRAHAAPEQMAKNKEDITVLTAGPCAVRTVIWWIRPRMAGEGREKHEILKWLEEAARQYRIVSDSSGFSFLKRGGRLTPVAAAIGSLLRLKPVVKLTEDGKEAG